MSLGEHDHPVNPGGVTAARAGVLSVDDAGRLAGLLGMLADPVRSRILFALSATDELCVGDLALALDVTEDQVSYALKMLRLAGLVAFRKDGRMVCYRLSDGFPHRLLEQCLRELLTIAGGRALMEMLRYHCALTGFRHQAGALPLAGSPAAAGGGNGPVRGGRKGPR